MTKQTTLIDVGQETILNLDADENGNFIAFTNNGTVITNDHQLKIDLALKTPFIRRLNSEMFFIVADWTDKPKNGHIYSFLGKKKKSFAVGIAIDDIIIHHDKIIITYFDEGVFGREGPNTDGVSVFDFSGKQVFGFNSIARYGRIFDCYCICKNKINTVLFYAYEDFFVYELYLDKTKVMVYEPPDDFMGFGAISGKQDKIFFHSSYSDKHSFFSWDRVTNEVIKFGHFNSRLKGIGNGKFLAFNDKGYSIVDPTE